LSFLMGGGQYSGITRNGATASSPAPCTAPTMDHRWAAWNPANTCTSGCTTGNNVTSMPDMGTVGGSTANGNGVYTASAVNGLAAVQFNGSFYDLSASLSGAPTQISMYAILNINSQGGSFTGAVCCGQGVPEWLMGNTGGMGFNKNQQVAIGSSTTNVSATTYVTVAVTYNTSTGALNYYRCSGGSCTNVGTATNATTFSGNWNRWGGSTFDPNFQGFVSELAETNSIITTTQLATWSQCKYGI
jgi:hypothetical protein